MLDKCTTVCRILFLLIITVLAVYFIYTNEKKSVEKFEETGADYEATISKVYNTLIGRDPTQEELDKYQKMMKNPNDTKEIVSAIAGSVEYRSMMGKGDNKSSTLILSDDKKLTIDFTERVDSYRKIMQVYEQSLNRLPNKKELDYYTYTLLTDKSFSIEKLKTVLESSQEYGILIKNQTNIVNAQLPGDVTDTQLTFMVRDAYEKVFNDEPSEQIEEFLKAKMIQYSMNDIKFNNLLLLLKTIDEDEMIITQDKDQSVLTIKAPNGSDSTDKIQSALMMLADSFDKSQVTLTKDDVLEDIVMPRIEESEENQVSLTTNPTVQNIFNIINPSAEELDELMKKASNKTGTGSYFKGTTQCTNNYRKKKYIDEFYEELEKTNYVPTCEAGDAKESMLVRDRDLLAEYTTNRNLDDLKLSCARNTYSKLTEESVSAKKKNPREIKETNYYVDTKPNFGTFLEEADNTKVGSIMPKFIYKEYA